MNLLERNSDGKLLELSRNAGAENKKFGKVDDIIAYLKEEAAKGNIPPGEVDLLALRVATNSNVLTQAAVDLMSKGSEGELKKILEGLNIYDARIQTWSDLQKYVADKTNGRIQPYELNRIAADILSGIDPRISQDREKITMYSNVSEKGEAIRQALKKADSMGKSDSGEWLRNFFNEASNLGVSNEELARLFYSLVADPVEDLEQFREELASKADDDLAAFLRSLDLSKLRIKSPEDLILYLLRNRNKGLYSEVDLFRLLAKMIAGKEIDPAIITDRAAGKAGNNLLVWWLLLGEAGLAIIIFILFRRRRKKQSKSLD
jgi:hypothetical protein